MPAPTIVIVMDSTTTLPMVRGLWQRKREQGDRMRYERAKASSGPMS